MRAPVSVVIPTLNAREALPGCLAALQEGLDAGLIREIIVSDGRSCDETLDIAAAAGITAVTGPPGRGGQLKRGASQARGPWLLFLHADSWLAAGWSQEVLDHIGAHQGPAAFSLAFRQSTTWGTTAEPSGLRAKIVAGWANLRSRKFGLPYGDQGLLVPHPLFREVEGYDDIPLMEDVAIARRLKPIRLLDTRIFTSEDKYSREGWFRRGAKNLTLLMRYFLGASPDILAEAYNRRR